MDKHSGGLIHQYKEKGWEEKANTELEVTVSDSYKTTSNR